MLKQYAAIVKASKAEYQKKIFNENQHLKKRTITATEAQQTTVTTYSTTQKTSKI